MKSKSILLLVFLFVFSGLASSCLKTRAQLKGEGDDTEGTPSAPIPSQIKDVQPQGQYVLDEIKSEITRLTGRIEDLERNAQQQQATGSPKEELIKLQARIGELEQAQAAMLEAIKKLQTAAPVPETPELFEKGKSAFQAKDYENAIESFTQYLKNPKAKHAEDATYLRGEAHYQFKQYKKAIIDFSKFPEKYHQSKKLPTALYRIGLSFDALGMKEDAKSFYQELADKFPKTAEGQKAKAKLK